ncbi:MAG TPA: TerB family tellurite resistance protein [Patescibacteria group bacterium]|nr:TerB family tellurite resistance protein [Patescibacteria group bacterium]
MTNAQPSVDKKPFTESMFYMWRGIILMAHADGVVHDKERVFFDRIFAKILHSYDATPEQMQMLARDMHETQDIDEVMRHVTEPLHKSLLVYFGQVVASLDGVLAYDEAALIGRLQGAFGAKPDTEDLMTDIRAEIVAYMQKRKTDAEAGKQREPIAYALDALLGRLGMEPLE